MKKLANLLVQHRLIFFVVSVIAAIFCATLIPQVTINKDQSKYLAKDSSMSKGLEIINSAFPLVEMKDSFQIMFENLTPSEKLTIFEELKLFDGVTGVGYDPDSVDYNTKSYTMYIVNTDYSYDSDKVAAVINSIIDTYPEHTIYYYYSGAVLDVLDKLIPMAVSIMLVFLLLISKSLLEPFLLIVSIGVAVLINMGTNVIFESVSDMTFAIAAVFQLVLSIDYSIMLLHRYEYEYNQLGRINKEKAMRDALLNSFGSVCSSSFTTIVGLLVLLLMSFTIGKDIGLVISKGVFFSLICVFTVMPSLIIWSSDLVYKLDKKNLKNLLKSKKQEVSNV